MAVCIAAGITDEANALNCFSLISRLTETWLPLHLALVCLLPRLHPQRDGWLAHIQENQNIVRSAPCACALLSKLTFKSKMESSPSLLFPTSSPLGELIKP